MRALVIEDDADLRGQLESALSQAGYAVDSAGDGTEGLYYAKEYPIDVAIVDLGLPQLDGLEVIRLLREDGKDVPILVLTARDRWQDKVKGLEAGADDYLAKPFHTEEMLARLRALLRRSGGWASANLRCGPIELEPGSQQVSVDNQAVDLTAYEYKVLEYLMLHAGDVVSKTELTEHIYGENEDRDSNVLEVFVRRLRKKLDPKQNLNPIETLRGRGYRLTLPRI